MGFLTNELQGIGTTNLSGDTFIDGTLTVSADQYFSGDTYIGGICEIDGSLTVDADTQINGDLELGGDISIHGPMKFYQAQEIYDEYYNSGSSYQHILYNREDVLGYTTDQTLNMVNGSLTFVKGLLLSGSTFTSYTAEQFTSYKGVWDGGRTYNRGEIVEINSNVYIALAATTTQDPITSQIAGLS